MNSQDLKIARKVGELISCFSEEWSEYQDWLRDIVSSKSTLDKRHRAWQATVIFRWRLLYFVTYVGKVIMINQISKKFKSFSTRIATIAKSFGLEQQRYIFQRTATLFAVAELTLCGIAAFTGILIAFYYQPTALGAYESLKMIVNEITNGSLILSLHNLAGNSLIVLALVQIIIMFLGRRFLLSWLTAWISGICLTLTAIGLSWTAIVLTWSQTSFWRFKIELNIVASIPLVGTFLRDILSGGNGINSITLQHMYAFHSYILAIVAIFLSITHLTASIWQEQNLESENKHFRSIQLCKKSAYQEDSSSA